MNIDVRRRARRVRNSRKNGDLYIAENDKVFLRKKQASLKLRLYVHFSGIWYKNTSRTADIEPVRKQTLYFIKKNTKSRIYQIYKFLIGI